MDPASRIAALYYRLPARGQNIALSALGLWTGRRRFGPGFDRRLTALRTTAGWTRARIESFQDRKVAELVAHAYEHTRYYRRIMSRQGLTPDDVRGVADLAKLPPLTKELIRENFDDLISTQVPRRSLITVTTSGSSGDPLSLLTSRSALRFKWAVWWRHREWHGMRRGDLHLNVTNKPVVPIGATKPPYWRWSRPDNQAILPMQQILPQNIESIVEFIDRTPFRFYSAYPSVVHSLAVQALADGITLAHGPEVVFTGAEGVLEQQRTDLREFAGASIAEMYGFNEGAGNASSCEELNLHEDFEFGYMEAADPETDPVTGIVSGRVLATGFATAAFPLIRYEVGDLMSWEPDGYRCPCGRESRVLAGIDGRWEDYIVTPQGHQARRLGDLFKGLAGVGQWQLVQERSDGIVLRVVRRPSYSSHDEDTLRRRVVAWIGDSLDVTFDYVDSIPAGANGKHQRIVSRLG